MSDADSQATEHRRHRYEVACSWAGSTGSGYAAYDRTHRTRIGDAGPELSTSADAAFHGDAELANPEQLLLAAAVSCQLLSFLAVAARARIDVVGYEDRGVAVMPEDDPPTRITEIHLRPTISVRGPVGEDRVRRLVEVAHRECFIANSLTTRIQVTPSVRIVPGGGEVSDTPATAHERRAAP